MAAKPGNKNAQGPHAPGAGRKSAVEELRDAHWHKEKWEEDQDVVALAKKIKTNRHSVRDVFLFKALSGDPRTLATFANKMLPDLQKLITPPSGLKIDLYGEALKRIGKWRK